MKFEFSKPTINLEFLDRISPFKPRYPLFAAELNRRNLIMVSMKKAKDGWHLGNYAIKEIPENAVGGSIFHPEITSHDELLDSFKDVFFKIGFRSSKLSLIIPDNIVRVALLSFPEIPKSSKQLTEMIMWKMKKSIPYRIEDTAISYQILGNEDQSGERVVLISLIPKNIVRQYEDLFTNMNVRVGLIDLSTFGIYNLFRERIGGSGDVGLINCSYNYFTFMIIRNANLLFVRCKNYQLHGGALEEEKQRVLKRELSTSLSYYTEKLSGKELSMTYIRSIGHDTTKLIQLLKEGGIGTCEVLDPSSIINFSAAPHCDKETQQKLIPAIGAVVGRVQ